MSFEMRRAVFKEGSQDMREEKKEKKYRVSDLKLKGLSLGSEFQRNSLVSFEIKEYSMRNFLYET